MFLVMILLFIKQVRREQLFKACFFKTHWHGTTVYQFSTYAGQP